jgi:hypothetical protein
MSRIRLYTSSVAVAALLLGGIAGAAPAAATTDGVDVPRYDSYTKPQRIDGAKHGVDSVTLDLSALTTQRKERVSNPENPASPIYRTAWVTWVAQKSGVATFSVYDADFGSGAADTTLALFTGSKVSSAKRVAFNDNIAEDNSLSQLVDVPVKKGRKYHLQVGVPSATPDPIGGTVKVSVVAGYAPANDAAKSAQKLAAKSGLFYATLAGATLETGEAGAPDADATKTVWFSFTPAADGIFTLSPWREIGTDYDFTSDGERISLAAYLKVKPVAPATVPTVQLPMSENSFDMVKGSTYLIQVGNLDAGADSAVAIAMLQYSVQYTSPWIKSVSPSSGKLAGGYEMTITGEGFDGTTDTVMIGGRVATIVSDSETSIVVTVPKGKSRSTVKVIVNGVSNPVSFKYK